MARDRQRSKARQQQRREDRLAQRGDAGTVPAKPDPVPTRDPAPERDPELEQQVDLAVGAPLEDLGTSDRTLREDPPEPSFATDDDTLFEDDESGGGRNGDGDDGGPGSGGPRGHRGGPEGGEQHKRGRLVAFLVAVWAELQRVQWPDRRQLTQLTGVVLFFVLIVGAYLGGLDAIFSKLIQAIL
jgi:preprotein translocase subunit SecE